MGLSVRARGAGGGGGGGVGGAKVSSDYATNINVLLDVSTPPS